MNRAKFLSTLVVAVITAAVPAGCGGGDDGDGAEAGTGKITTILPSRQIPYYRDLAEGIEAELERQGWESDVIFGDQTVPTNLNQVQTALTSQPDGMILAPVDQEA